MKEKIEHLLEFYLSDLNSLVPVIDFRGHFLTSEATALNKRVQRFIIGFEEIHDVYFNKFAAMEQEQSGPDRSQQKEILIRLLSARQKSITRSLKLIHTKAEILLEQAQEHETPLTEPHKLLRLASLTFDDIVTAWKTLQSPLRAAGGVLMLQEHEHALFPPPFPRVPITRGIIVLDFGTEFLATALRQINMIPICRPQNMAEDQFLSNILAGRLLLTKTSVAYILRASSYCYGILDVEGLSLGTPDSDQMKSAVQTISRAIIEHQLWDRRHGFLLRLGNDGNHTYRLLID